MLVRTKRLLFWVRTSLLCHRVAASDLSIVLLVLMPVASFGWHISPNFDDNGIGGVFNGANFQGE